MTRIHEYSEKTIACRWMVCVIVGSLAISKSNAFTGGLGIGFVPAAGPTAWGVAQRTGVEFSRALCAKAISQEDFLQLLDESVMLYGALDYATLSSDEAVTADLKDLRKEEILSLVEDLVDSQTADATETLSPSAPASIERQEMPSSTDVSSLSLAELTQQLDKAILEGYQATFTQEEFDVWTEHIENLHIALEDRLANQSNPVEAESTTPPSKMAAPDLSNDMRSPSLEEMQTRLQNLKTVINPPSRFIKMAPVASKASTTVQEKVENGGDETAKLIVVKSEKEEVVMVDEKVEEIEIAEEIIVDAVEVIPAELEATTIAVEDAPVEDIVKTESLESQEDDDEESESTTITIGADFVVAEEPESSAAETLDSVPHVCDDVNTTAAIVAADMEDQAVDAVSAIISAAAIGAVAVTKIPYFAAGIALGPVVKQSIDYAKTALNARQAAAAQAQKKREAAKAAEEEKRQ